VEGEGEEVCGVGEGELKSLVTGEGLCAGGVSPSGGGLIPLNFLFFEGFLRVDEIGCEGSQLIVMTGVGGLYSCFF
jgi:hypothetical protein